MIFEYLCSKCEATNIFKSIGGLSEKNCRHCGIKLHTQKDLVRYERDKDGDLEMLLQERVERLVISISDIYDRLDRLETAVLGDADDEDLVTVN